MNLVHDKSFVDLMRKVVPVVREKYPAWDHFSFGQLCDRFAWYWNRGLMAVHVDKNDQVDAIALIKIFDRLSQFMEPYQFEPEGQFCQVELLIATNRKGFITVFKGLSDHWGPRPIVLWDRGDRTEEGKAPRMYSWNQYLELVRRMYTYGQSKNA